MGFAGRIKAGQAYVEITADNSKLIRGLSAAQATLRNFGQSLKGVGADMMQVAGVATLPIIGAIKQFADFDDRIRSLHAISRATGSEIADLRKYIRQLGADTAFTAQQVAQGAVELSRMGFNATDVKNGIRPAMDLVRATGTETFRLGEVSAYAAASLRAFGLDSSNFSHVCDIMAYSANNSAMNIADMGEAMKIAGPSANSLGENLSDTAAALMLMANAGIRGSLAGTSLRKVYQSLAAQSGKTKGLTQAEIDEGIRGKDQLAAMGIKIVDPKTGNLRKSADIMADIAQYVKGMKTGEKINFATDVFDVRGSLGALSMLSNPEQLKEFLKQLQNISGYAKKTAEDMEKGIGGCIRSLISKFQDMNLIIGSAFEETFAPWIKGLPEMVRSFNEFLASNKKVIAYVAAGIAAVAALGVAFFALGAVLKIMVFGLGGIIGTIKVLATVLLLPVNAVNYLRFALLGLWKGLNVIKTGVVAAASSFKFFQLAVNAGIALSRAMAAALTGAVYAIIGVFHGLIGVTKLVMLSFSAVATVIRGLPVAFATVRGAFSAAAIASAVHNGALVAGKAAVVGFTAAITFLKSALIAAKTAMASLTFAKFLGGMLAVTAAIGVAMAVFSVLKSIVGSLGEVLGKALSGLKSIGASCMSVFGKIGGIARDAFGVIKDAFGAGDMAGAAQVALAALYNAWMEGVTPLKKVWFGLKKTILDVWAAVKRDVLLIVNELWYGMLETLNKVGIVDAVDTMCVSIVNAFDKALIAIKVAWRRMKLKRAGMDDKSLNEAMKYYEQNEMGRVKEREDALAQRIADRAKGSFAKKRASNAEEITQNYRESKSENAMSYTVSMNQADEDLTEARRGYESAKAFAAQWKTMQSVAKLMQKTFEDAQENYRLESFSKDTESQERIKKLSAPGTDPELIKKAILSERNNIQQTADAFKAALERAKEDRVIDANEQAILKNLSYEYGRASELKSVFEGLLNNAAQGTAAAMAASSKSENIGSWSAKALQNMLGMTSPAERTARAAEQQNSLTVLSNLKLDKIVKGRTGAVFGV